MNRFTHFAPLCQQVLELFHYQGGAEDTNHFGARIDRYSQGESGDKAAASVKDIVSNPDRLLGVILLRITSYNVCYTKLLRMSPVRARRTATLIASRRSGTR